MSFKDMRTMKADLFLLCLDTIFVRNQLQNQTRYNNSQEREGGCVPDPRKQKNSGSKTVSIFGSQLTNTESTKTQQQQKPLVHSMHYSQENQKNESMDNSEHYSQHKMFQFCLKCNVTLLSLFQSSYLGEGRKEQQKVQCGKTFQLLIYGKAKST